MHPAAPSLRSIQPGSLLTLGKLRHPPVMTSAPVSACLADQGAATSALCGPVLPCQPLMTSLHGAQLLGCACSCISWCRSFYVGLRDWIVQTELDRYRSGRVFEYMWHYIFGEPSVISPIPMCQLVQCPVNASAPAAKSMAPSLRARDGSFSHPAVQWQGLQAAVFLQQLIGLA